MSWIDDLVGKTARQISKAYNDALEAAIRKNREFLRRARDVEKGKIKPPGGMKTEKQKEAWKRGYLQRAAEKSDVVERIAREMQEAGVSVRKKIQASMARVYEKSRKNVLKLLDRVAPSDLPEITRKEIELLLYRDGASGAFSKIAMKNLGSDARAVKRLRNEFAQAIKRGEGDEQMIARIRNITGMEEKHAKLVLRTEKTHIESLAKQETAMEHYRATGKRSRKKWHCTFRNSRDSHMAMDGQTVWIDEDFTLPSGAPIGYPGDSRAGAEEVCNCQCWMEILEG